MTSKTGGSVSKHGTFTSFGRFVSFRAWEKERVAAHESQSQTQRPKSARVGLPAPLRPSPLFLPSTDSNGKHKREKRGEEWDGGWKDATYMVRQGTGRHDAMGAGRTEGGVNASAVVYCENGRFCLIRPK